MNMLSEEQLGLNDIVKFKQLLKTCSSEDFKNHNVKGLNCLHLACSLGLVRHVSAIVEQVESVLDIKSTSET